MTSLQEPKNHFELTNWTSYKTADRVWQLMGIIDDMEIQRIHIRMKEMPDAYKKRKEPLTIYSFETESDPYITLMETPSEKMFYRFSLQ